MSGNYDLLANQKLHPLLLFDNSRSLIDPSNRPRADRVTFVIKLHNSVNVEKKNIFYELLKTYIMSISIIIHLLLSKENFILK